MVGKYHRVIFGGLEFHYFTLRFQFYIVVVWNFQLFMLPLVLLVIFIKNLLVVQVGDAILKEKKPDVRTEGRVPFKIFQNSQWLFSMWGSEFLLVYCTEVEIREIQLYRWRGFQIPASLP